MACSNDPDNFITIGRETFSLVEIPQADTELVKEQKECLLSVLDLASLLADFGKLEVFIHIACNGTAGNEELQIKVRVAKKIYFLVERSAVIVKDIIETTSSDLKKLQNIFQFLLRDRENIAMETLNLLFIEARFMEKKVEELIMGFDNVTTEVINALEDTQRTKCAREKHREDLKRTRWKKDEIRLEEETIDALHNSIGALKSLSAVMMNAALFWRQMQAHCESLASKDMQRLIERAMKYPEEKRFKVWTSNSFKAKGIIYYSKWVALDDVCRTLMEQIKQTSKPV